MFLFDALIAPFRKYRKNLKVAKRKEALGTSLYYLLHTYMLQTKEYILLLIEFCIPVACDILFNTRMGFHRCPHLQKLGLVHGLDRSAVILQKRVEF